ncbi:thioesterase family protein [Amycolatopsis sp. QT-25]|uniref:thioesterase family protein n=1 Tax=Amycolatopsis sp. QT-25 TaxID=3034022 RepID=UPI0023ECEA16|nr:thioesterase family protein [Amycolatopsis sp. QT-25]WET82887.1 thioesterase family protein [Amycolatopsis sp. QT-25]
MTAAFYVPSGDGVFLPTPHTAGPWTPDAQHFGPPSALLVRALEELDAPHASQLARVTIEILGPAPLKELSARAWVQRPGRSVEWLQAELSRGERVVARAAAWRIATSDTTAVATPEGPPLPPPDGLPPPSWPESWHGGYLDAVEWRRISGSPDTPGPATVWGRQRVALVDGEKPSALQRLFVLADSGNGISNFLDPREWWFINSELTVHLRRPPLGDWLGVEAATLVGPNGIGTATTTLHDASGPIASGAQALLVRPRQAG